MRDVEADLDKRVTVSKLASTPVIKELKTSLDKLRATNEDLETRLKELEKGPRR
jgi:cell division protein FtsB